ncbi:hypothetical protein KP509_15G023800 [Ceratopteris richardii]|uniref:Uncharacterized protein n=1 Tax=Ceratopteris richardii TaxID=49495 RepID=A0A8T2T1T1_CERRI|nr:hypothetical protein KP509_15G023800 [Ceratopteris richardii]
MCHPKLVISYRLRLQATIQLQKWKEARDHSFLLTDEDATASSCKDERQFTRKERQGDKPMKPIITRKEGLHVSSTILGCAKPTPQFQQKLPVLSKEQSTDGKKPPPLFERKLQLSDNNCQRHSGTKIDCGSSIRDHCHQKRPLGTESVTKPKMV